MDLPVLRSQLADIDPPTLGSRIKAARIRAGLTQGQVSRGVLSISYLSRIESGQRRPDSTALLALAERLGVAADELVEPATSDVAPSGPPAPPYPAVDFAEIAVAMGDAQVALTHLDTLDPDELSSADHARAETVRARALESTGDLNGAIGVVERLLVRTEVETDRVSLAIMLSRCHRELGELDDATRVGQDVLARAAAAGLDSSDEVVQLRVTVAAAYYEKGELDHALRLCRDALALAEGLGSPAAQAAAVWETSVVTMEKGEPENAVDMARRALVLMGEGVDAELLTRLRLHVGLMELQVSDPDVAHARATLSTAANEMQLNHSTGTERLEVELGLARCDLLEGDPDAAWNEAQRLLLVAERISPVSEADVLTLLGRAAGARGDIAGARECLLKAVHRLHAVGSTREAAQRWMELGHLLEQVGELAAAVTAYRAAATSTGLRPLTKPMPDLVGNLPVGAPRP